MSAEQPLWTEFYIPHIISVGRDSVVGIAIRYGLDGLGIECRWGQDFLHPLQTGPGAAHPASYTVGIGSLSWGWSGWGMTLTTNPHLVLRLKKE